MARPHPTPPINGTPEADSLDGTPGDDIVNGLDGGDTLSGLDGRDSLLGGTGGDTLYGGAGDDVLEGDLDDDLLFGGDGNDFLRGGFSGVDTLDGGVGDDLFNIEDGSQATAYGGTGDDRMIVQAGVSASVLDAGDGTDILEIVRSPAKPDTIVRLDLADGDGRLRLGGGKEVTLIGFETVHLASGGKADQVATGAGDDVLDVGDGANTVSAGGGDDAVTYRAGRASNHLDGGAGSFDLLTVEAAVNHAVVFSAGSGTDAAGSTITGFERFAILGSDLADDVTLGSAADVAYGGAGDDQARGGGGADTLEGGLGADTLRGDAGDDAISGGDGADKLFGGTGADAFVFLAGEAGTDRVKDFEADEDRIEVDPGLTGGVLASGPLDPARFHDGAASGLGGQFVLIHQSGGDLLVWDANGTRSGGVTELAVLQAGSGLTADDILII